MPEHTKQNKHIIQYDIWGNKVREWNSAHEITRELGFDNTLIGRVLKKQCLQAYGYQWINDENEKPLNLFNKIPLKFGIIQKDMNGNIINKFLSLNAAATSLGKINGKNRISNCCKKKQSTYIGYKWEYDYSIWNEQPYQKGNDI